MLLVLFLAMVTIPLIHTYKYRTYSQPSLQRCSLSYLLIGYVKRMKIGSILVEIMTFVSLAHKSSSEAVVNITFYLAIQALSPVKESLLMTITI